MCNCQRSRPGMITTEERKAQREARAQEQIERRARRIAAREAAQSRRGR